MPLPAVPGCGKLLRTYRGAPASCPLNGRFLHLTKSGGSEVERALGIPFQGHARLSRRDDRDASCFAEGALPYFTLLRHPLERKLSLYSFWRSGRNQFMYKVRQAAFCERGTGRAYSTPCKPKQSFAAWLNRTEDTVSTAKQLAGDVDGVRVSADGVLYEQNDYMIFYLQQLLAKAPPLSSVIRLLESRFFLIGVTEQLPAFVAMAHCSHPARSTRPSPPVRVTNNSSHATLESLLHGAEYDAAARANLRDMYLYRWAEARSEALTRCLLDGWRTSWPPGVGAGSAITAAGMDHCPWTASSTI